MMTWIVEIEMGPVHVKFVNFRRTSEEERRNAKEETKKLLQRRLSYR